MVGFRRVLLGLAAAGAAAAVVSAFLIDNAPECSAAVPTLTTVPPAEPVPSTTEPVTEPSPVSPEQAAALGEAVAAEVDDVVPGTDIGLVVYDRLTGSTVASVNADREFYTASVVKLLIGIHALYDADWEIPTGSARDDLVAMLARSNDGVASMLWVSYGNTAIIDRAAELIDLSETTPPNNPAQWELTKMSPRDALRVYEYIGNHMPKPAGSFIQDALAEATAQAADGFDQHFGIPDALPDVERAIKQGWMRTNNAVVLNTTGLVGPDQRYVIVLLTEQPVTTSFDTAQKAVTTGITVLAPALTTEADHTDTGEAPTAVN